uniref:Sp4 transcription factor n=1 Tax=Cyprinus carpio TaxID=7962 RepID=A0A8C1T6G4_CYPCA
MYQKKEAMATDGGKAGGGEVGAKGKSSGSQDAQPSPLALLAATCSKIGGAGGEGQTATQQQIIIDPNQGLLQLQNPTQQLELVPAQLTGNGWQIIATSPTTATKDSVQQQAANESAAGRKVKAAGSNNAPGSQQQQQFQIIQVQNLPNSSGGIQYQVIPHLQTADGQQIQISPSNPTALSVQPEQIQLISTGNNQAILATPQRAGSTGIVAQNQTIPLQIRPSFPLQLQTIQGSQAPMVTTLPINLGGVTLALPVINNVAAATGGGASVQLVQSGDGSISNGNQASTAESTCGTASDAIADATTLSNAAESQKDSQAGESDAQNLAQSNGLQSVSEQPGQIQQFQIVGHPVLQQIQSPQQQVVQGSIQTLQPVQQNLQLQAFQNPTQVLIRTPTLTPSGQISWQMVQVQNAGMPQQLTLAPVVSSSSGATFTQIAPLTLGGSPITLSAAQLPSGTGVQTVNIAGLGAAGVQMQGVPLTITGVQGQQQGQEGVKVQSAPVTVTVGNISSTSPEQMGQVQSPSDQEGQPGKRLRRVACSCPNCRDGEGRYRKKLSWNCEEKSQNCRIIILIKKNSELFECPECSKRFMRSDHLSKHIKTHQNKKGGAALTIITTDEMEEEVDESLGSPRIVTVASLSQDSNPATPTTSNNLEEEFE